MAVAWRYDFVHTNVSVQCMRLHTVSTISPSALLSRRALMMSLEEGTEEKKEGSTLQGRCSRIFYTQTKGRPSNPFELHGLQGIFVASWNTSARATIRSMPPMLSTPYSLQLSILRRQSCMAWAMDETSEPCEKPPLTVLGIGPPGGSCCKQAPGARPN